MNKSIVIQRLKERMHQYSNQLKYNQIEYASFIVEVGALTVTTDETGKVIPQNALYPTQFSESAANEIVNLNWKNGNDEKITPIIFPSNEWYSSKMQQIKDTLVLLQEQENYSVITNA